METTTRSDEAKQQTNVQALITDRVIAKLTGNIVPWYKVWGSAGPPVNLITRKPYTGINALILGMEDFQVNVFLSYKQVTEIGGKVKKDEKGIPVVYWPTASEAGGKTEPKYYTVFHVSQCEGIPEEHLWAVPRYTTEEQDVAAAMEIVKGMPKPPKIMQMGAISFYDLLEDIVYMPKRNKKRDADYYGSLFRQMVHSTGHDNRLVRKEVARMSCAAGNELFSKEDLVGMIGAYFLCGITGIKPAWGASPVFIAGWREELKKNDKLIFVAAKEAQKAVNHILGKQKEETSEVQ